MSDESLEELKRRNDALGQRLEEARRGLNLPTPRSREPRQWTISGELLNLVKLIVWGLPLP
jgi:hypothetical protein